MSQTLLALLGYASWTLLLLLGVMGLRLFHVFARHKRPDSFLLDGSDLPPFGRRLTRTFANASEHLPLFAAVVWVAVTSGHAALTDPLAPWLLAARIAQSCVHLVSTRSRAILLRFLMLCVQVAILLVWVIALWRTNAV